MDERVVADTEDEGFSIPPDPEATGPEAETEEEEARAEESRRREDVDPKDCAAL